MRYQRINKRLEMITIELPFPPSILSFNNKKNWRSKVSSKMKYRDDCRLWASQYKPKFADVKIPMKIVFHEPDKRGRDADGMLHSAKAAIDGVCLAWGINDKRLRPITIDDGEVIKGGKVVITFG